MAAGRFYLRLSGMNAVHAVRALRTSLGGIPGVIHAEVKMGEAVVSHDGRVNEKAIRDAVKYAGLGVVSLSDDRRRRLPLLD